MSHKTSVSFAESGNSPPTRLLLSYACAACVPTVRLAQVTVPSKNLTQQHPLPRARKSLVASEPNAVKGPGLREHRSAAPPVHPSCETTLGSVAGPFTVGRARRLAA